MEKEKKLAKDALTYMVANFGAKILILIIYPIYTYFITPNDLGVYDLIISTLTLIYPIAVFSINDAVFRWLLDKDSTEQLEIISIGLKITFRNLFIIDIIYTLVNLFFNFRYGWFILLIINFGAIYPVLQQIARGLKQNRIFALSGIVYALILIIANVFFVIVLKMNVNGLLMSQFIAYYMACIYLLISVKKLRFKWWKTTCSQKMLKDMTEYSLMLIPNSCCWWIMNASDRYMIRFFIGNAANGIYAISHKFPSVMNMFTSVFTLAWQEHAILEFKSEDRDEFYSKIYKIYYRALFCLCCLLLPITKWFVEIFIQSDYSSAWECCAELYLGSVFQALASFLGTGYLSIKNTKGSMITSLVGALINIIVNLFLLPVIGLEAAALSTLIANICIWLVRWIQMKNIYNIKVDWIEFGLLVILAIIVGIVIRFSTFLIDVMMIVALLVFCILKNKDVINMSISAIKNIGRKFS